MNDMPNGVILIMSGAYGRVIGFSMTAFRAILVHRASFSSPIRMNVWLWRTFDEMTIVHLIRGIQYLRNLDGLS